MAAGDASALSPLREGRVVDAGTHDQVQRVLVPPVSEEKMFQRWTCPERFADRSQLHGHQLNDHGEAPRECPEVIASNAAVEP